MEESKVLEAIRKMDGWRISKYKCAGDKYFTFKVRKIARCVVCGKTYNIKENTNALEHDEQLNICNPCYETY